MAKVPDDATVYIYALCCPDCGEFKYIGQSVNPETRFRTHLSDDSYSSIGANKKRDWIRQLREQGKAPELFIIEKTIKKNATLLEWQWIHRIRKAGYTLLNYTLNVPGYF